MQDSIEPITQTGRLQLARVLQLSKNNLEATLKKQNLGNKSFETLKAASRVERI